MKKIFASILIATGAQLACASGLESLENFVKTVKTGKAAFTQVVTAPAKDGQAARSKTSSGTFEFQRPSRFRFVYQKPFAQTIVADGQTLWLHDVDLNQVIQPQRLAVGHDALGEGFFVDELEPVRPLEFKAAAGCFAARSLAVLRRSGHHLGELGAAGFHGFDEIFQAF